MPATLTRTAPPGTRERPLTVAHAEPDPPDSQELGALIRQARERRGLRQTDLAAAIHVGLSAIGAYERGIHELPAAKLLEIGRALNVRFVADPEHGWRVEEESTSPLPAVILAGTAEAMHAALDRLRVPPKA